MRETGLAVSAVDLIGKLPARYQLVRALSRPEFHAGTDRRPALSALPLVWSEERSSALLPASQYGTWLVWTLPRHLAIPRSSPASTRPDLMDSYFATRRTTHRRMRPGGIGFRPDGEAPTEIPPRPDSRHIWPRALSDGSHTRLTRCAPVGRLASELITADGDDATGRDRPRRA